MRDYDAAREELRTAELALMQHREAVAEQRRNLPAGPVAGQYVFDTPDGPITLDSLVDDRPLIVYHFMFGAAMAEPCPMCAMWADGWNGIVDHVDQQADFALVTLATAEQNATLASAQGWQNLRWLSAANNSFKADFGSVDTEQNQSPFVTVFERDRGTVRLSYSGSAHITNEHGRGIDLLSPVWHMFDLTRQGRDDFMPSRSYSGSGR